MQMQILWRYIRTTFQGGGDDIGPVYTFLASHRVLPALIQQIKDVFCS